MCLSRGSWKQNDEIREGNTSSDLVTEVEAENQILCEPGAPPGSSPSTGTFSHGGTASEALIQQLTSLSKDQAASFSSD